MSITYSITLAKPLLAIYIVYLASIVTYNLYFHPLACFPGPKLHGGTPIPYVWHQLRGDLPFIYRKLHDKYGDVVRVLPNELSFNTASAWQGIYTVRSGHQLPTKDPKVVVPSDEGAYNIVTVPNIADHARYRRTLNAGFSEKAVREQEHIVRGHLDLLITRLYKHATAPKTSGKPQDLVFWLTLLTFDIIADLTFGESLHGLEEEKYHPWVEGLFGSVMKHASLKRAIGYFPHIKPLLDAFLPQTLLEQRAKHAHFVSERVEKRMKMDSASNNRSDFMSFILPYDPEKVHMSLPEIRATFGVLIMAGSENLATTVDFTIYHLLKNPGAWERLTQEVRGRFQSEEEITFLSVASLPYLAATLSESMRIQPAAPASQPRVVPEGGDVISGHYVPGGARVAIPPICMNHDPRYFKHPRLFRPERWLGDPEYKDDVKSATHPFGTGPRSCAGRPLALAEMKLIIARIVWNFDLELTADSKTWGEDLKIFHLWDITPLYVRFTHVDRA
ncbi:hypothetical protein ASPVEDRAFT_33377 [Aspergillus versicolor CBS 583.65]|uniref:Cytochrome P450 n=1 Tax=Aspergillus versicolor CBS 583.65 TaxID=1036611 RepID=A0A1L9Q043_ASPVE|nr:uncharacterized protein ASPVEDRAFT_33377 [Aspergillus versicolor CBS 583.65]OJJ07137.1 hypothetical protein ASPVEDRAFT_33377 [Aspergillus versicolor CBS 583.65]